MNASFKEITRISIAYAVYIIWHINVILTDKKCYMSCTFQ